MAWLTGYSRENVDWFPTVDPEKCVKCGICMNCGKNVYDWTKDGAIVARPFNCVVGCTTCANLCLGKMLNVEGQTSEVEGRSEISFFSDFGLYDFPVLDF